MEHPWNGRTLRASHECRGCDDGYLRTGAALRLPRYAAWKLKEAGNPVSHKNGKVYSVPVLETKRLPIHASEFRRVPHRAMSFNAKVSVCLFIGLPVYLLDYLFVISSVHRFICSSVRLVKGLLAHSVDLSICPSARRFSGPSVHLVHLSNGPSIHRFVFPLVHLFIDLSVHFSICSLICLFHWSICLLVHLSVGSSVHLFIGFSVHSFVC